MAVKQKPTNQPYSFRAQADLIEEHVNKLLNAHAAEILDTLAESETNKLTVNFGVNLDASEAVMAVKTSIRFSSSVTDSLTGNVDDPNQPRLPGLSPEEIREKEDEARQRALERGEISGTVGAHEPDAEPAATGKPRRKPAAKRAKKAGKQES